MRKKSAEERIKICHKLDKNLLSKLESLSLNSGYPQSRLLDDGIEYVLKKNAIPSKGKLERAEITLTVNLNLWNQLKKYADLNNYKLVHLLELALNHAAKKYNRKLREKSLNRFLKN